MEKQQFPTTVWCGGVNGNQDVSIRLVPNTFLHQRETNLRSQEPLAVFKVHSTRLKRHSKYFQACLSRRWTNRDAPPSMEFTLELTHGLQVASYTDCFSRMYTPLRRNFKDVQSSLELLRVASQIAFLELVNSICRYLSTIPWSDEDEFRIRQFSLSLDFPRSEATDLVARLEIGDHGNEDSRKKLLCGHIAHNMRIALRQEKRESVRRRSYRGAQSFFEDFLCNIRESKINSAFEEDVVAIFSKEVKEALESFHEDCRKHASFDNLLGETSVGIIKFEGLHVRDFRRKLKGLCWALELLLKAQVAEEVVECLLHLELFMAILLAARTIDSRQPASKNVALQFCKLFIFMFQMVVAGRLLLGIPDRVLLIRSWQCLDGLFEDTQKGIPGVGKALEGVFLTLPLQQQLELLKQSDDLLPQRFICSKKLITLMKRNWSAEEDASLQADEEADHGPGCI